MEKQKQDASLLCTNVTTDTALTVSVYEHTYTQMGLQLLFIPQKVNFSRIPQNESQVFTCHIKDDGFETVKNQGRQDINNKWRDIENYWVDVIIKQSGDESVKWIHPNTALSYQIPEQSFRIDEADFKIVIHKAK